MSKADDGRVVEIRERFKGCESECERGCILPQTHSDLRYVLSLLADRIDHNGCEFCDKDVAQHGTAPVCIECYNAALAARPHGEKCIKCGYKRSDSHSGSACECVYGEDEKVVRDILGRYSFIGSAEREGLVSEIAVALARARCANRPDSDDITGAAI